MRGSKGPLVAVDLRPLQAGYKAHLERGIGRHARGLVRALADIVPKGRIKFFVSPGPAPDLDGESIPVEFLRWPGWIERVPAGRETAFRLAGLSSAVRVLDVRVAHFLSHTDAPLGRLGGTRLVVTAHDIIPVVFRKEYAGWNPIRNLRSRFGTALNVRVLEKADRIIAVSEATKKDLVGTLGVSPAKITVIPNGVDRFDEPARFDVERLKATNGLMRSYLLHVGGIDRRKNVNLLPEVLRRARAGGLDLDLVFAGRIEKEPEFPSLAGAVRAAGVEKNVRFLGYVPDADLSALYAGAWALVEPSLFEGFGLPVLEAMAAGAPVVASNRGAIPEVAGDAALLVEPEEGPIVDALGRLASEVGLRGLLLARGKERIAFFDWRRAAEMTVRVYEEAAGEPL
jgi:glycosyltransferase involved in cell wall biosynthesis